LRDCGWFDGTTEKPKENIRRDARGEGLGPVGLVLVGVVHHTLHNDERQGLGVSDLANRGRLHIDGEGLAHPALGESRPNAWIACDIVVASHRTYLYVVRDLR